MLSDLAAEELRRIRDERGLTREDVAELCKSKNVGRPDLTYGVITSIETGRRGKDGVRKREITVDELVALSRALEVPPILMLAPLGYVDQVEILPGFEMRTLDALQYLIGGWARADDDFVIAIKPGRQTDLRVQTYLNYDEALGEWWGAGQQRDDDAKQRWWARIQELQRTMQEHGWRIPPLPGEDPGGHRDEG